VYLPSPAFLLLLDVLLWMTLREFFTMLKPQSLDRYWLSVLLAAALPWVWVYAPGAVLVYLCGSVVAILSWCVFQTRVMKEGFASASGNLLGLLYVAVPLAVAGGLQRGKGRELIALLVIVWLMDSAAYFVGRTWGAHKVTPIMSPNKSLEGYAAGLIASTLTGVACSAGPTPAWTLGFGVLAGLVVGICGTLGDLFESVLKRGAGVKDSSSLLPGHGGMLDRIDSLLFALPAYFVLSEAAAASGRWLP
jgi:phosphatidate cytidylyltransferase